MLVIDCTHILDSDTGDMIACVERIENNALNLWDVEGDIEAWTRIHATGDAFWKELSAWVADNLGRGEESFYFTDKNESEILW